MTSKEEELRNLHRLMVRVSGVFMALIFAFTPSWTEKMSEAGFVFGDMIIFTLCSSFSFAFLTSFIPLLKPRIMLGFTAISAWLLISGVGYAMTIVLSAYLIPTIEFSFFAALLVVEYVITLPGTWRDISRRYGRASA